MSKAQNKKDLAEAGRRKLEAFRKQKAEGKSKAPKGAPPDIAPAADSPSPRKALPKQPPPPPHQGSGALAPQSNVDLADTRAVRQRSGSKDEEPQQEGPSGRGPGASSQSIPFSLSSPDVGQQNADTALGKASIAPPATSSSAAAAAATGSHAYAPAASTSTLQQTRPPRAARGLLFGALPTPPPLPLPPPPPQFNFRASQPPPVSAPTKDSPQGDRGREESTQSSSSSSSDSKQLRELPAAEARAKPASAEEHSQEKTVQRSSAQLERDPFGSLFRAPDRPQQSPPQPSSSRSGQTAPAGPSGLDSPPPGASALQPSATSAEGASPQREHQGDTPASAGMVTAVASAESGPLSESIAIRAANGYAALSDGYLSPSRLEEATPSPGRQPEPDQVEVLPVSRSAGLNRLDSASPAPSGRTSEAAAPASPRLRPLQGPSSSNGYSALSDGYIGRSPGGNEKADSNGNHSNGGLKPGEGGWLGDRGSPYGAGAGTSAAKQAAQTGKAGSSFADLFDAVLSDNKGSRKPHSFSPSRGTGSNAAAVAQEPPPPPQHATSGSADTHTPSAPAWQQHTASAATSWPRTSGPPPPQLQPSASVSDEIAPLGRRAPGDADTDTGSRLAEGALDVSGPASAPRANGGTSGFDPWARPSPPPSSGEPRSVGPGSNDGGRARFAALQQHIDELTREKYEMLRGMAGQRKVTESLEDENQKIADDFNRQAGQVGALGKQVEQLRAEVDAQRMALAAIAAERDAARSSAADSSQRLERLAAEVVELEERLLRARSNELRAEKEAAQQAHAARRAQSAAQSAQLERGSLQSIIDTLQEEKRSLHVKLRKAVLGERLRAEQPPKDASTQTTATSAASPSKTAAAAPATPRQRSALLDDAPSMVAPSVRMAQEALDAHASEDGLSDEPLSAALCHLLPPLVYQGGVAGNAAELIVQERAALSNIHAMLATLESQQRSLLSSLHAKEEESRELGTENAELRSRLEAAQQRLELAVSRSTFVAAAPQPQAAASEPAEAAAACGGRRQLFTESAPSTPAQPLRRPLRAPKAEEPRRGALNWVLEFLVPHPQTSQRIGQFG